MRPAAISSSARRACSRARSFVSVTTHSSCGPYRSRRSRYISVSSCDLTCRVRISSESFVTGQNATSSRFAGRVTRPGSERRGRRSAFTAVGGRTPGTTGSKRRAGITEFGISTDRIAAYDSSFRFSPRTISSRCASVNSSPAICSACSIISFVTFPCPSAHSTPGKSVPLSPVAAKYAMKRRRSIRPAVSARTSALMRPSVLRVDDAHTRFRPGPPRSPRRGPVSPPFVFTIRPREYAHPAPATPPAQQTTPPRPRPAQ